jgi:hypothetical protein
MIKAASKMAVVALNSVNGLPRNQHCHDRRFPGACCQLQGEPHQLRVCLGICIRKMLSESLTELSSFWRNFGQPYDSLYRLDLAKEGTNAVKFVVAPVLQQARCLRCDQPIV